MVDPLVSVIMPVRNEESFIERSLGAVLAQDYPADRIEVLIADGMSDDRTREIVRALDVDHRVTILDNPARIQSAGMNQAIEAAKGDILIRVDGHTIIAPDYVRECVSALAETGAQNVGGPMNPVGITPMGKAIAAAGKSSFAVPSAFHVSQKAQFTDTVYMGAWPKSLFATVKGYDEALVINEDYELNVRIRKAGGKLYFTPKIQSQYYGRQTLGALAKQYYRYGIGKTETLRLHPGSLRPRQLVAPAFVVGLIGGAVLSLISVWFFALWLLGIAAYLALALIFTIKAAGTRDLGLLWRMPLVFATIHLSWGVGFWVGLLRG
ncbi:MAG: glycosyltransferase family 2 protein [Anaerolineae bacterium]